MDLLNIIGAVASIIGLLVSLFVAQKVMKIDSDIHVKGDRNIIAGRDIQQKR